MRRSTFWQPSVGIARPPIRAVECLTEHDLPGPADAVLNDEEEGDLA